MTKLKKVIFWLMKDDLYCLYGELANENKRVAKHKQGIANSKNQISYWYHKLLYKHACGMRNSFLSSVESQKKRCIKARDEIQ